MWCSDPEGEELQQKASNIEEQGRKMDVASPTAMKYIPIFKIAQNTGIILQVRYLVHLIGQTQIIMQVNQSACKLVGKTAVQLEGFSINNILPDVVASNHDHLMKKFSQEGEHHSIITIERELFFQHSKGHIVIGVMLPIVFNSASDVLA
jgi:PAS domain S-box-containing protein